MPLKTFKTLDGVPVHYARPPAGEYGTRGKSYPFKCTDAFLNLLEGFFKELHQVCWLKKPEVITSAGAKVEKPGYHGSGDAFDIDAVFWKDFEFVTLDFPKLPVFYLGFESILRRHFGTVLNYLYNPAHQDHFHIDSGSPVGFSRASRSRILYLQAVSKYVFNIPVKVDGKWGPETLNAVDQVKALLAKNYDINTKKGWTDLLFDIANYAFALTESERSTSDDPIPVVGEVAASKLNIRSSPDLSGEKVAQPLKEGSKVEILEKSGEWYKVETSIQGWVHSKYIKG